MGIRKYLCQGCRYVESKINEDWRGFLHGLNLRNVKYPRLDIALDDYKRNFKFQCYREKSKVWLRLLVHQKNENVEESYFLQVLSKENLIIREKVRENNLFWNTWFQCIYSFLRQEKEQENKGIKVDVDSWQRYDSVKKRKQDFIERFIEGETFDSLYLELFQVPLGLRR